MAKEKIYDAMASQIGDLGGDLTGAPSASTEGQVGLGKLKHKSSYGQKEDLTPEEEAAKDAFLQRQRRKVEEREEFGSDNNVEIAEGWIPVNREEMGIRSQFYPSDWEFYIRPATVQAIKNWISVDENSLYQLNRVFNEICKLCIKIKKSNGEVVSWGNINSWDRFWFIIKVRELTFASNKKTIDFEDECAECDQTITFELRSDNLVYEFPDDELVDKYWDGQNWVIDPTEYDIDHDVITLYTPTLSKEDAIIDWARRERERGKKLDETFPKFLPWLVNKFSRDETVVDRQIKKALVDYKSWDVDFYRFMNDVIDNITINPSEKLKQVCPHCGEEVISNVQFPNGIKILFDVATGGKKFGSR